MLAGFVRARQTSAHRPRLEPIIKPSPPSGVAITRCRVAHHTSSNITRRISAAPGAKSLQRRIACIFTTDRHLPSYVVGVAATVALYRKYERVGVYVTFKTIHLLRFNGMYAASCKFRHEDYLATTDARTVPEYRVDHRNCTLYSTHRPILTLVNVAHTGSREHDELSKYQEASIPRKRNSIQRFWRRTTTYLSYSYTCSLNARRR